MRKIFDQLNERGKNFSSKKFEYEDECIEDSEEADMSTQFLRIQKNQLIDLKQHLERYVKTLPVFGFNSGRYDLILIKSYLIPNLIRDKEQETSVIKKANDFIFFKFGDVQFLDIMKFLGGATTLDSFQKAYKARETKGFFPYEWFDNPGKLDFPELPPYEAFFSKLRNNNPLDKDFIDYEKLRKSGFDEQQALKELQIKTVPSSGLDNYNYLQETWKKNGMTVFRDFLKWYNNRDVVPTLEAMQKMIQFYHNKGIDILKLGCTLQNLANICLHKSTNYKFYPFCESDLCEKIRADMTGGPSIVFHCFHYHFCSCQEARPSLTEQDIERGNKKREMDDMRREYIKEKGYKVEEMWECDWWESFKTDDKIKNHVRTHFPYKRPLSTDSRLAKIIDGSLFGYVQCDLVVPDELKSKFANFPPIFKNTEVERDDIGDYMKNYAIENEMLKHPQRMLISSFKLENGTVITPLFNFYMELGLQCTNIYRFVQYFPRECFNNFVQSVVDAGREGDENPLSGVVAETMKLLGKSSYGYQIMDRSRHTITKYLNDEKTHKAINEPLFKRLNSVEKDLYEVELLKSTIEHREPIIVGFFILQYAKLRMLELY